MTWRFVQSAIPNFAWSAVLSCVLGFLSGCDAEQSPREVLIFEAPTGPAGGTITVPDSDPALADFAGTTLQVPPRAFASPVTLQFYRVAGWDAPGARSAGPALKIVASGTDSQTALDVLHLSMPLPDARSASGDRNLMAVEWSSGERFYTGGRTLRPQGQSPRLEIETPTLGAFFPVIYPFGPALPDEVVTPLDVLFVVDNSSSMSAFQSMLFEHTGSAMQQLKSLPWTMFNRGTGDKCKPAGSLNSISNIHMAVASSDLGVMPPLPLMAGSDWPSPLPTAFTMGKCGPRTDAAMKQHGNGDNANLQTELCTTRGITAKDGCPSSCSTALPMLESSLPYVRKWQVTKFNPITMMYEDQLFPTYATGNAETALHCRAVLGQKGCGIEMPLGSAAQAIARQSSTPSDFLRDPATSLLVVVVVTNEDDCTILATRRKDEYPSHAKYLANASGLREDCNLLSAPECFNMEYRCFALDNVCATDLSSPGMKTGCQIKSVNPNPFLASVESLVKQMATYQDAMGVTNYRNIGFVTVNPSSKDFEVEYLPDGMMSSPKLTPYLNVKMKEKMVAGKTFQIGPQLRYEKLYQLKNSMVAAERFSDPNLSTYVRFVIQSDIEQLIDPATGTTNKTELAKLTDRFHKEIAPYIHLTKAGKDSSYMEPCP